MSNKISLNSFNIDLTHSEINDTKIIQDFFNVKSNHELEKTMSFFSKNLKTYTDATLGWEFNGYQSIHDLFTKYMPSWPKEALSYPTRILGGNGSFIVEFTDTPELFGGELRILGAIDFKDDKIIRWIDYWDGRNLNSNLYNQLKTPNYTTETDYKEAQVNNSTSLIMNKMSYELHEAFNQEKTILPLLSNDAVYEDIALKTKIIGKIQIQDYLNKNLYQLPFGEGSRIRHILGNDKGGGFEWIASKKTKVLHGITAIELNEESMITRITTMYDSRLLNKTQLSNLIMNPFMD